MADRRPAASERNSDEVAKLLGEVGYADVRVYKGGKADWQAAGLPLEFGRAASM